MGVGYDTVNQALVGELAWWTLVTIVIAKTIASAACFGLGLPVGMIGPTLVIGATFGGALGYAGSALIPADASSQGFYAMLGMTAMMAAVLQAPLAALMAVVELTANPNIILPAMLIIVVATLTVSEVFKQRSLLITTLSVLGMEYPPDPTSQLLRRAGIASIMQREFVRLNGVLDIAEVRRALQTGPRWIVVEEDGQTLCLLNAADVENHIDGLPDDEELRLMELPAMRKDVADIDIRATLHEAVVIFDQSGVEALCIRRTSAPLIAPVVGVLTRDDFDDYTRFTARR